MSPTRLHNVNALEIQAVVTRLAAVRFWEDEGATYRQEVPPRTTDPDECWQAPAPSKAGCTLRFIGIMLIAALVTFWAFMTTLLLVYQGSAAGMLFAALTLAFIVWLLFQVAFHDHMDIEDEISEWRRAYHAALRHDSRDARKSPPPCPDDIPRSRRSG